MCGHHGYRPSSIGSADSVYSPSQPPPSSCPVLRGVSVMEDEGGLGDHLSGVSATDGNWHHVVRAFRI